MLQSSFSPADLLRPVAQACSSPLYRHHSQVLLASRWGELPQVIGTAASTPPPTQSLCSASVSKMAIERNQIWHLWPFHLVQRNWIPHSIFIDSESMQAKNKITQLLQTVLTLTTLVFSKLPAKWIHTSTALKGPAPVLQSLSSLLSLLKVIQILFWFA